MMGRYAGISNLNLPLNADCNDISGNANNPGTVVDVTYGLGRFGQAAIFNGSSSRANFTGHATLAPTTFTFNCWYKGAEAGYGTLYANWRNITSKYYGFFVGLSGGPARILVAKGTGTSGSDMATAYSSSSVNNNVWRMITATYDGATIRIYVDGAKEGSTSWSPLVYPVNTGDQWPMIGARQDTAVTYSEYLDGSMDELFLLPYVMTDQDIRRWYAYSKGLLI